MAGPDGSTDGELVRRCLRGERRAFDLLVHRYQDVLFRHARGMVGTEDDAADVVQQTFLRGYRKLRSCRDPERVGGWLFRICSNICRDHLKDPRRRERPLEGAPGPVVSLGPDRELERTLLRGEIDRALRSLPEDQREAFLLKHVEGRSYEEMCELTGASIPALKMRVHRAREGLAVLLEAHR